jgi:hypothetical protein
MSHPADWPASELVQYRGDHPTNPSIAAEGTACIGSAECEDGGHEGCVLAVWMHQVLLRYGNAIEQFGYRADKGPWLF